MTQLDQNPASAHPATVETSSSRASFPHKHLLGIKDLNPDDIQLLLSAAAGYFDHNRKARKSLDLLRGLTQFNLFFENSTRTLMSFEVAGKRLGMDVVDFGAATSSVKKGETLRDTAKTLDAMGPAVMVIRHSDGGAIQDIASHVGCAVINAGDGTNEHPTQALLDAATMLRHKDSLNGLNVTICGDIAHSRVAGSNIILLHKMGANVTLVGPQELMPTDAESKGARVAHSIEDGLEGADVVMMLRIQKERLAGDLSMSDDDYFHHWGLSRTRLSLAKPDAIVMHPGPMNRRVEIADDVADDKSRSVILEQVEMGVALRMAVLETLTSHILED